MPFFDSLFRDGTQALLFLAGFSGVCSLAVMTFFSLNKKYNKANAWGITYAFVLLGGIICER